MRTQDRRTVRGRTSRARGWRKEDRGRGMLWS